MKYVRVRDPETGHEFSTPETDPYIRKGRVKVVDRKPVTSLPLPPKFQPPKLKKSPSDDSKES